MDLETATATLAMLEGQEEKKSKKKKLKKEKFPAPFSEVQVPTAAEILKDLDINELAPGNYNHFILTRRLQDKKLTVAFLAQLVSASVS